MRTGASRPFFFASCRFGLADGASALAVGILLLLFGCARPSVNDYIKPGVTVSRIESLGILPFDNISGHPDAGTKVVNLWLTELSRTGLFRLADVGELEKNLRRLRVRTTSELDLSKLRALRDELDIQAVVVGSVDEYELRQTRGRSVPVVAISARILDAETGDILWAATNTHDGDDWETVFGFGRVISLSELSRRVVIEMIEALERDLPSGPEQPVEGATSR